MDNEYFENAAFFLKKAALFIVEGLSNQNIIDATLFFALGMERVLKGVLFSLNPIYVYKIQDFKNTVPLLYQDKLLSNFKQNKEIAKNPDADVLTFRASLSKAKSISETTEKHTSLLFSLSNFRDIISHNELRMLNHDKMRLMLLRDFFPLIKNYCQELEINRPFFLGQVDIKLATISSEHQDNVEDKIKLKLDAHKDRWEILRKNPGYTNKMDGKTKASLEQVKNKVGIDQVSIDCPACENGAILTIEIDFDVDVHGRTAVPSGAFVSKLHCFYCKLQIDDYDEIDHLKFNELITPEPEY